MDINTPSKNTFRTDINGLRAWAVTSVVLYHFGISGFGGGFIGVDIFFVISGYLMTALIVNRLNDPRTNNFSLTDFYLARARRIVPALAAICAILLVVGWLLLPPSTYTQLALDIVSAILFLSNFKFWREAGYFDTASHDKWLLHTWSLSVEWQFYLALPLVLMLTWRISSTRRAIFYILISAFITSLGLSIVFTSRNPTAAFYLLPTRAWEMLSGGLILMLAESRTPTPALGKWLEASGFALIISAIIFMNPSSPWPGWRALLPVTGTALVLWAARSKSILTGGQLPQLIGNASYSIYLWHWPIVVFLTYLDALDRSIPIVIGLISTITLGHFSYKFIERFSRERLGSASRLKNLAAWTTVFCTIAVPSIAIYLSKGIDGRLNRDIDRVFAEANNKNQRTLECHATPPKKVPECRYGGSQIGAIVIGDSHAATIIRTVERSMGNPTDYVLDWTYAGCPTLLGVHRTDPKYGDQCGQFIQSAINRQTNMPKVPLVIVNRSSVYIGGFNELSKKTESGHSIVYFTRTQATASMSLADQFKMSLVHTACTFAKTRPVYLMRPVPELIRDVPKTMGRALIFGKKQRVSISVAEYMERNHLTIEAQDEARARCGVHILDPLPYLCVDGRCWGDRDGLPIYFDDNHLNERGAALLQPMFESIFHPPLVTQISSNLKKPVNSDMTETVYQIHQSQDTQSLDPQKEKF